MLVVTFMATRWQNGQLGSLFAMEIVKEEALELLEGSTTVSYARLVKLNKNNSFFFSLN